MGGRLQTSVRENYDIHCAPLCFEFRAGWSPIQPMGLRSLCVCLCGPIYVCGKSVGVLDHVCPLIEL